MATQRASQGAPRAAEGLLDRRRELAVGLVAAAAAAWAITSASAEVRSHRELPFIFSYSVSAPAAAVALYLVAVHVVAPYYLRHVHPEARIADPQSPHSPAMLAREAALKRVLRWWNLFLSFGSLVMLLGGVAPIFAFAWREGIVGVLCDPRRELWRGATAVWAWAFTLSKFVELLDTALLVLRNKTVGFLHWYHHFTVLLYAWVAYLLTFPAAMLFYIVNAFVHTVMYWYYYRSACGAHLSYTKLITQLQIAQMLLGVLASCGWAALHFTRASECDADAPLAVILASVVMYGSYLLLFLSYYVNRYLRGRPPHGVKEA